MAIKSFQGKRKEQEETAMPILVSDYMAKKLTTFSRNQPVLEVMEILIKRQISGGPVVDERNRLIGMISEGDCMKQISESRYFNVPMIDDTVEKYMVSEVETIDHDVNIFDVASVFHKGMRRRLPVLKKGKLIGQISRKDVLKAALKMKSQKW